MNHDGSSINYRPTKLDECFARWVVGHKKNGDVWAMPCADGMSFRIYHEPRGGRLVCDDGGPFDAVMYAKAKAVFALVGYVVSKLSEGQAAGGGPPPDG